MRKVILFATLAVALPLAYFLGSALFEQDASHSTVATKAPLPTVPTLGMADGFEATGQRSGLDQRASRSAEKSEREIVKLRRKTRHVVKDTGLASPPPLVSAPVGQSANLYDVKNQVPVRQVSNPMKGRWIDDLSGQKARLSMGKSRTEGDCGDAGDGCVHLEAPKDLNLVGVVVDTDKLTSQNLGMEGRLVRGHYRKRTPALYLK